MGYVLCTHTLRIVSALTCDVHRTCSHKFIREISVLYSNTKGLTWSSGMGIRRRGSSRRITAEIYTYKLCRRTVARVFVLCTVFFFFPEAFSFVRLAPSHARTGHYVRV